MKIKQDRNDYNIGKNIRKYRLKCGLTQEQTVARLQLRGIRMSRGSDFHDHVSYEKCSVSFYLEDSPWKGVF